MRRIVGGIAALAMIVAAASGAVTSAAKKKGTTAKHSAPAKKPVTALQKSVAKKRAITSASARNTTPRNTTGNTASRKVTPAKSAVTWRNRQLQPTQDRYKEIQTALVSKGYLQPEQATGTWDQNSSDALKQFQAAQNLDTSGKINSLSLIALGLGPKHEAAPALAAQPVEQSR
jgi:ABC-type uncharacterized transport system involved in gliding motility auxiliary subunit